MNNLINISQWHTLVHTVHQNSINSKQPDDVLYVGEAILNSTVNTQPRKRFYCYDNYDRIDSPGFDFVINEGQSQGTLTVYNGSEQARAPVSFDQALEIAQNFFDFEGSELAENIVCDWVMDGNSTSL